ncbi:hypothetical protein Dimus_039007 [Dionaea muscipula]
MKIMQTHPNITMNTPHKSQIIKQTMPRTSLPSNSCQTQSDYTKNPIILMNSNQTMENQNLNQLLPFYQDKEESPRPQWIPRILHTSSNQMQKNSKTKDEEEKWKSPRHLKLSLLLLLP